MEEFSMGPKDDNINGTEPLSSRPSNLIAYLWLLPHVTSSGTSYPCVELNIN